MRRRIGLFAALAFLCAIAAPASGVDKPVATATKEKDDPRARLRQLEQDMARDRAKKEAIQKRADDLAAEIENARTRATRAARAAQDSERMLARLEAEIAQLARDEAEAETRLHARRAQAGAAAMALQRLALHPPEAMFAQPVPPSDTVRGGILLRAAVPEIERRAALVRADLDILRAARETAAARRVAHAAEAAHLAQERRTLDEALAHKAALQKEVVAQGRATEQRLAALAAEAKGLNELMARIETEQAKRRAAEAAAAQAAAKAAAAKPAARPVPESRKPTAAPPPSNTAFAKARGRMPMPVVGQIVLRYGQTTRAGLTHKGITLETQGGSTVIAPFAGYVVFAGEFRGYGQLLILDHGDGYHTLLAGLTRIDGVPGLWVETGEPVGIMGQLGAQGGSQGGASRPQLYVEIRRGGQPVDPLPWLAAGNGNNKVSG